MEKTVNNLAELEREANFFVAGLNPIETGATLVTLSGELGAGKTTFTQMVAKALGVEEMVTSPTFVLEKIYKIRHPMSDFKRLVHVDAYRLESGADLAALGFDEIMNDSSNLVFLEWPEKVAGSLPVPASRISFKIISDTARTISYD